MENSKFFINVSESFGGVPDDAAHISYIILRDKEVDGLRVGVQIRTYYYGVSNERTNERHRRRLFAQPSFMLHPAALHRRSNKEHRALPRRTERLRR